MFKKWLTRIVDKWRMDEWEKNEPESTEHIRKRKKFGQKTNSSSIAVKSNHRVSHNFDDNSVITFKVYGANGGKIVEASRYDDKRDNEVIKLYIIEETADFTESLSRIVTMEYLR